MIDTSFLALLDRFSLIIKKKITSNYVGSRASTSYGSGLIFKDYRDYVMGDDIRAIDWNIYARTEELFVKRFEEERNITIKIIVDASASMNFGEKIKKFEYASMIGLGFTHMALKNNERFEFSTFAEQLVTYRAKKGKSQLLAILSYLNSTTAKGKSNFKRSLEEYRKTVSSRSMIVLISDFLFDLQELKDILYRYKKTEVYVVQVLDPIERNLEIYGDLLLKDSESNDMLRTFLSHRLKEKIKEKLNAHIFEIQEICGETNSKFISVTTDTSIFDTFYGILK